jgi:HPt (histidine-containing phosphotransfer) domain-containing protein
MDGYVTKPINREALRQAILELEINNPSTPSSHCGFDWGTFIRRMGNEELATRMVKAFLYEDEPRLESELQDAIDRSDGSGIHHAAHALRGALGELGAADAVESAWQLESMGKESELQDIQQTYDAFVIQIRSLTEELAKRVTKQ